MFWIFTAVIALVAGAGGGGPAFLFVITMLSLVRGGVALARAAWGDRERVKSSTASGFTTPPPAPPPGYTVLTLNPGREIFLPAKPRGQRFMVEIQGTYLYRWQEMSSYSRCADALWDTAGGPNFLHRYPGLVVNGNTLDREPFSQDRELHRYVFVARGDGNKHGLLLKPPFKSDSAPGWASGELTVTVRPPTHEEQTALNDRDVEARAEAERVWEAEVQTERKAKERAEREEAERIWAKLAAEAERLAEERDLAAKRRVDEEAKRRACDEQQAEAERAEIRRMLQHEYDAKGELYTSKDYIEKLARSQGRQLLARRADIELEYREFFADGELIAFLERAAPHLIAFKTWKMRALTRAEELAVEPTQPPSPPRTFTPDEFRERLLRGPRSEFEDVEALQREKMKAREQIRAIAKSIEDEDERDRYTTEMSEEIDRIFARARVREEESRERFERV